MTISAAQDTDAADDKATLTHYLVANFPAVHHTLLTVTVTDDDEVPAVTVNFGSATYTAAEGDDVTVTVTLSADPERSVTIPLTATNQDGASDADYSGVPANVAFGANERSKTFTFHAAQDTVDDDGESVLLGFGSLPARVTEGTRGAATVSITDDDVPAVTVNFGQAAYSVAEGDDVTVTVTLSADPERTVTIPLTATNQDGASNGDYSGIPANVAFGANERSKTFTFTATQDLVDDDGESVLLGFGSLPTLVTEGGTPTSTVSITDDDDPAVTVSFGSATYTAAEGGSVTVTVQLNADPERTVTIPLTATNQDGASDADYSGVPANVTFAANERSKTFTFTATQDTVDDDGESVLLGFGSLPARVTEGTRGAATVSITDDDVPAVTVNFGSATYTAVEGGNVSVTVTLSADPERTVIIPIIRTNQDGASNGDYSGVPANVTFAANERSKTFTFTATQDTVDDDGESVLLGFGSLPARVTEGTRGAATVSITDDDVPAVTVNFGQAAYSVAEGDDVTVTVTLSADPERTVTIPLTATNQDGATDADYSGVPANVAFGANERSKTFTFHAAQDTVDDDGESVLLGFGSLPARVTEGTRGAATVSITDDDVPAVTVNFGQAAYSVAEGDDVTVTVTLSADPERTVTIPLTATNQDGASNGDYSGIPANVAFGANERSKTFTFTATQDLVDDDGESVLLGFGSLPTLVTEGGTPTSTVSITDDDDPAVTVSFGSATYTAPEGGSATVTVTLSADPERTVTIPLTATNQDGASDADYSGVPANVAFGANERSKTFTFHAAQDTVDDDGESVLLGFGSLPARVTEGTRGAATVSITDDDVPAVTVNFGQAAYSVAEGDDVTVTVTLSADPERTVTIPLTATNQDGATDADYSGVPTNVTFSAGGATSKTFTFTATQDTVDDDGERVLLGFTALPARVTEGGTATSTVSITDDDDPAVTVSFGQAAYSVAEGDDVTVTVTLSADPERTVTIPLTATNQDGATDADYSGVPTNVTFSAGGATSQTFTFTAVDDTVDDDGERVLLGFTALPTRVTEGGTATSTVSITDDDDPAVTVSFGSATYTAPEGGSATVTVTLSADPERSVTIPLTATNQDGASDADYSGVPANVAFGANERSKTFTFHAAQDTVDDDGESVLLGFGSLPARVTEGTRGAATVSITDDDVPAVTVNFGQAAYSVAEGDDVTVTVTLSADPERTVTIPLTATNQDGASNGDYSGIPANVAFGANERSKTFTFTATQDLVDDDGESVLLGFGSLPTLVTEGGTPTSTVSITDDDDPAVTVSFGSATYTAAEGGSVTVTVQLNADPERTVTIPLTATNQDGASDADYSGVPANVTFGANERSKTFTFTATQDTVDDDGESVLLGFGSLPARVTEGTRGAATVSITDDDVPAVTVNFGSATYTAVEGGNVSVTVTLSADPERTVIIPIIRTNQDGASNGDYSGVPANVTFISGDTEKTIIFSAAADNDNDDGESVKLTLGNLPDGVSAGSTAEATVSITDDDVPSVVAVRVEPHPPVNVQASATDERVTLLWQGNVSNFQVSGYRIERYEGHSSGWETLEPLWPAASEFPWDNPDMLETYVDTDVLPSAPYRYRIWSVNDRGIRSLYAAGVDVETAVDPPGLRISADHGRVTIGWDAPEDDSVTGYRILRRVQWGLEETPVGDTGRGVTGWVDRQVSPGTAYAYRLQALHDGRPGARSRYLFALTPRIATPTVVVSEPDGQDLTAGTETIGRIDVGGSVTGTIDSVDDRDWFAVEMEAGETYHARLSYMTEDGLRSFSNGRVVLGCLMDADGTDSPDICLYKGRVQFEVQRAGRYYIVVQPRWYRADLGHPEMPTEYELELDHDVDLPQDSSLPAPYGALRTSSEVEVGTWVSGQLHNGDRADNHRVQLREGHWYRVPVFFDYGPEADGVVANAGAVRIGTGQQNSRWSDTSPHLFRASQTGTHYLNVAREADISTIYATRNTYYFREATYKFLVEDLGTLEVEEGNHVAGPEGEQPGHRLARHHRDGAGRRDADRDHGRDRGRGRSDGRGLRLPVGPPRPGDLRRRGYRRSDGLHLHRDRRRRGQGHQGARHLRRRRAQRRIADQLHKAVRPAPGHPRRGGDAAAGREHPGDGRAGYRRLAGSRADPDRDHVGHRGRGRPVGGGLRLPVGPP